MVLADGGNSSRSAIDLLKSVQSASWKAMSGNFAGDDLVPTDATRACSAYLLKIREAKPDLVVINLAGNLTTKLPQAVCRVRPELPGRWVRLRHSALAWAAGKGNFVGTWHGGWRHLVGTLATKALRRPPSGQEIRRAAGEPGLGRLRRYQDQVAQTGQRSGIGGIAEDHRAPKKREG